MNLGRLDDANLGLVRAHSANLNAVREERPDRDVEVLNDAVDRGCADKPLARFPELNGRRRNPEGLGELNLGQPARPSKEAQIMAEHFLNRLSHRRPPSSPPPGSASASFGAPSPET